MNKPLCLLMAPVGTVSGYGARSRDIATALIKSGKYDVRIWSTPWGSTPTNALSQDNPDHTEIVRRLMTSPNLEKQPELFVQITVPSEFQRLGKFNIGITAGIETTIASAEWIEGVNRMDLVLTSSEFSKKVFMDSKFVQHDANTNQPVGELSVQKPIEVLFEGVNLDVYDKVDQVNKTIADQLADVKENFAFLFVGHWLKGDLGQDRKNVGMLIRTFLEAFKNKAPHNQPALILKTSGADFSTIDRDAIMHKIKQIYNSVPSKMVPNVYFIHGDLTDEEMNSLYNHPKVKAHITFTRGEGYGRPLAEAALSQKPVIATNWSGHTDFLKHSVLLPGQLENVHPSAVWEKVIIPESQWFTVDYGYAGSVMRHVAENYKDYLLNAKKQSTFIKKEVSLDAMNTKFIEYLDKYVPEFPVQAQLKLPQLKKIELPKLKKVEA